jgi:hypothetical protein
VAHLARVMARLTAEPPPDAKPQQSDEQQPRAGVDGPDLLAAIGALRRLRDQLTGWEPELIGAARGLGITWADLAPALGLASRQAAERRYLRLNPNTDEQPATTGEQRVQATRTQRSGDRAVAGWARDNAAILRQLAGQITALTDLADPARRPGRTNSADTGDATASGHVGIPRVAPAARAHLARVHHALGGNDAADLLAPLSAAEPTLRTTHPGLADQITALNQAAEQVRADAHNQRNTPLAPTHEQIPGE